MDGFEFENCGNAMLKLRFWSVTALRVLNLTLQRRKSFTRIAKCLNFQALLRAAEVFLQP